MDVAPKTILFATDGTPTSAAALEAACDVAERSGADLHIVHVWGDPFAVTDGGGAVTTQEAIAMSVAMREQARAVFLGASHPYVHTVRGMRGSSILRVAARERADMIVVGGRPPSLLTDLLSTRVSRTVVRWSPVSVLLVPASVTWPPARVVGALEGRADAALVAPVAAWAARTLRAELHLTHIVPAVEPDTDAASRELVHDVAERAASGDLPAVEFTVLHGGSVARTLLERGAAHGTPLLVMGARELRALAREGRNSVADDVVRRTCAPVLLVPQGIRVAGRNVGRSRAAAAQRSVR